MFSTKPYIFEGDRIINFTGTKLQELHKIKYEPFKKAWIKEKGKLELARNRKAYNIQDIPIPSPRTKWVTMQEELQTKLKMIKPWWTFLATFGKDKVSEFHVEELAASQIVKLLMGEKHWEFWAPGCDPDKDPSEKIKQNAGEDLYIPGGWWHRVTTKSNGALLIGVIFREKDTPIAFGKCLRVIGVHQGHQGDTPQSIENEAQTLLKQLNIKLPRPKKGDRVGVRGRAAKRLQMEAFRKVGGVKNKRRDTGGKVFRKRHKFSGKLSGKLSGRYFPEDLQKKYPETHPALQIYNS
jgi:hypothetical protein